MPSNLQWWNKGTGGFNRVIQVRAPGIPQGNTKKRELDDNMKINI